MRTEWKSARNSLSFPSRSAMTATAMSRCRRRYAVRTLEGALFVGKKQNLVLYGPVGTGKTHMAIAAGMEACRRGHRTKFYTVTDLIRSLSSASRDGTLDRLQKELEATELLILDEWEYVPVDREGVRLLFRVIADSYEQKNLILTTNIEFSKWGIPKVKVGNSDNFFKENHLKNIFFFFQLTNSLTPSTSSIVYL